MKTDIYTKSILTIIAFCFVWMCARDFIAPSSVQAAPPTAAQGVVIVGVKIPLKDGSGAQVTDINGKPIYTWELPVRQGSR